MHTQGEASNGVECPRAVIFDLDDTLTESFKRPSEEVLGRLRSLLDHIPVAIMTGTGFKRMEAQFLDQLTISPRIDRFYLFPNSSAQCYVYEHGAWTLLYNFALTPEERAHIKAVILETVGTVDSLREVPHWGERMFDREAQIAYTPVGIEASRETKSSWDPDGAKRGALFDALRRALPEFEILMGGTTTVDITRRGINKAYGVKWFSQRLSLAPQKMLYVGDAFHDGGNDLVVVPTGIRTRPVSGPEETRRVLDELLAACASV